MLFKDGIFRSEAVVRQGRVEPLDVRLQSNAPHEWLFLTGLGVALAAIVLWLFLGRVEQSLSAQAVLVKAGERHALFAPVSGTIAESFAEEGDRLVAGQPIALVMWPGEFYRMPNPRDSMLDSQADIETAKSSEAGETPQTPAESLRAPDLDGGLIRSPRDGELIGYRLTAGRFVTAGSLIAYVRSDVVVGGDVYDAWEVLAFVTRDQAARLKTGMTAQMQVNNFGGDDQLRFSGEISEVGMRAQEIPQWIRDLGFEVGGRFHLVRVALAQGAQPPVAGGGMGSLRIVVERHAPIALLAPK